MGRAVQSKGPKGSSSQAKQSKKGRRAVEEEEEEEEEEMEEEDDEEEEQEDERQDDDLGSDDEREVIDKSASGRFVATMSKSERDRKITDIIRCILALDTNASPIRRDAIKQQCFTAEHDKAHSKGLSALIYYASVRLDKVFGMKLVAIPLGKDLEAAAAVHQDGGVASEGKQAFHNSTVWVVMNTLTHSQKEVSVVLSQKENSEMGLLIVVLAYIHMKDNTVLDLALFKHLKGLQVDPAKKHPVFGDIKKLLNDFVKERFLVKIKAARNDSSQCYEYKWGSRAYKELSPIDVYEFVAEIFGSDVSPALLNKLNVMKRKRDRRNSHDEE